MKYRPRSAYMIAESKSYPSLTDSRLPFITGTGLPVNDPEGMAWHEPGQQQQARGSTREPGAAGREIRAYRAEIVAKSGRGGRKRQRGQRSGQRDGQAHGGPPILLVVCSSLPVSLKYCARLRPQVDLPTPLLHSATFGRLSS
ncbi:unnamed protein product [Calypogeia fissa]